MKRQKSKPGRLFQLALNDAIESRLISPPKSKNEEKNKRSNWCTGEIPHTQNAENNTGLVSRNVCAMGKKVPAVSETKEECLYNGSKLKQTTPLYKSAYHESQSQLSPLHNIACPVENYKFSSNDYDLPCAITKEEDQNHPHSKEHFTSKDAFADNNLITPNSLHEMRVSKFIEMEKPITTNFNHLDSSSMNNEFQNLHFAKECTKSGKFDFTAATENCEFDISKYDLPLCSQACDPSKLKKIEDFRTKNIFEHFPKHSYQMDAAKCSEFQRIQEITPSSLELFDCPSLRNAMSEQSDKKSNFANNFLQSSLESDNSVRFNEEITNILHKFIRELPARNIEHKSTSPIPAIATGVTLIKPPTSINQQHSVKFDAIPSPVSIDKVYKNMINQELTLPTGNSFIKPPVMTHPSMQLDRIPPPNYFESCSTNSLNDDDAFIKPHRINSTKHNVNSVGMVINRADNSLRSVSSEILAQPLSVSDSNSQILRHFDSLIYNTDNKCSVQELGSNENYDIFSRFGNCDIQFPKSEFQCTGNFQHRKSIDNWFDNYELKYNNYPCTNINNASSISPYSSSLDTKLLNVGDEASICFHNQCSTKPNYILSNLKISESSSYVSNTKSEMNALYKTDKDCNPLNYNILDQQHFSKSEINDIFNSDILKDLPSKNTLPLQQFNGKLCSKMAPNSSTSTKFPNSECMIEKFIKQQMPTKSYSHNISYDPYFRQDVSTKSTLTFNSLSEGDLSRKFDPTSLESNENFSISLDSGLGTASYDSLDNLENKIPFLPSRMNWNIRNSIL